LVKVNLGCGKYKKKGFVNVDIEPEVDPDFVVNLDKDKLPFEDNSVDYIYSHHVFEHLKNFRHVFEECYRVLKDGSRMDIVVPYATSLSGDYEYHTIRPRYMVFKEFEDEDKCMVGRKPLFKIDRHLSFTIWFKFMAVINSSEKLRGLYEGTGLRYLMPGNILTLKCKKIGADRS
jgi:predicted SAM-dependent methyltransferase